MRQIDFYALTRTVQDNLLESLRAEFEPKPIVARAGTRPLVPVWFGLSGLASVLLVTLYVAGIGDVESALSMHPTALIVVYLVLAGAMAFGVFQALAYRAKLEVLPFATGVYVFPACVIDARDRRLRVHPLSEVTNVSASGRNVVVRFGLTSFSFPVEPTSVALGVQRVQAAVEHLKSGLEDAELRKLDPLEPPVVANPLASTVPLPDKTPTWIRFRWPSAAVFGIAVGALLFFVRSGRSDTMMFATAKARDDVTSYEKYLGRGEAHKEVVSRELLPRAALRFAIEEGTVEAVDAFTEQYPDTAIADEVASARQSAMVTAFEEARAASTLIALLSFAERYPDHGLQKFLDEAVHAIYVRALNRTRNEMPAGAEATAQFVEQLLVAAEKVGAKKQGDRAVGATVEVRVRHIASRDLERADDLVQKNPMYTGVKSLPRRYLDAEHFAPHEKAITTAISQELATLFDPEVLAFAPGEPLPASKKKKPKLPEFTTPTVVVSYRVEPSGAAYASKKPLGIFIGLLFRFTVDFVLPGGGKPLHVKHAFTQRIPVELLRGIKGQPPRGTLETKLYNEMVKQAFADLQKRFLVQWVKPKPAE